ncbi:MAG: prepilin peptidase [Acidimicrobiales bacterium]
MDASAATLAAAVVGFFAGVVLDPLAQQLAEDSRAADAAAAAAAAAAAEAVSLDEGEPGTGGCSPYQKAGQEAVEETTVDGGAPLTPPGAGVAAGRPPTVALVPAGRNPTRTVVAGLVTGALAAAAAHRLGAQLTLVAYGLLFAVLVAVSVTDLSHRLVPRRLVYPGAVVVAAALVADALNEQDPRRLVGAAIGGAVAFGVFFAVWWFVPRGMGFGDVRLAGLIGLALGYLGLFDAYLGFLSAFVLGALGGVAVMVVTGSGRRTRVPFAPALAAGAVIAVLAGPHVASSLFGGGG